tara:strand:+ start:1874 stop:2434 length:561 start_codon:yes stop_codon:yes gene_type:complete
MKTPILETARLILRPISLDDAPAIQKYFNNWDIIKYMNYRVPWPYPDDGAESFMHENILPRIAKGGLYVWAITEKGGDDELIGLIEFNQDDHSEDNRHFWLAQPFHGHGYMTEVVCAINDFVFEVLGLERYEVSNSIGNIASRRIKEKTGAVFLKTVPCDFHSGDTISERWEVTKASWAEAKKELK